jgi:hypothetical protein
MTKELLESHHVELQKIVKQDGFHLEQFDVFVDQNMRSFQEGKGDPMDSDRWGSRSQENRGPSFLSETEIVSTPIYSGMQGRQRIDLFI